MIFFLTISFLFFFNDTAPTEIYTLSLHDALPISLRRDLFCEAAGELERALGSEISGQDLRVGRPFDGLDRKSTRLNSSHSSISYAVFCLKKKKKKKNKNNIIDKKRHTTRSDNKVR